MDFASKSCLPTFRNSVLKSLHVLVLFVWTKDLRTSRAFRAIWLAPFEWSCLICCILSESKSVPIQGLVVCPKKFRCPMKSVINGCKTDKCM